MKTFLRITLLAALTLPVLTACAAPSRAKEAEALRRALADLPGVADASLDYTEPVILDTGKLELHVDMVDDADAADAIEVVVTAYAGFAGTHHGEEGDVHVVLGDDAIHLRSFEPDAKVDAVERAATHAAAALPSGAVTADINTQDVDNSSHVFTGYAVKIPAQGADDVLEKLTDLERRHADVPDAGWGVETRGASEWQLRSSEGFPDEKQRDLFNQLRGDLPEDTSILLHDEFVNVRVPHTAGPDEISAMVGRHLRLLGGVGEAYYDVTQGEDFYAMITLGDCTFATGEFGARLSQDHGAACTKLTKAAS